MKILVVCQHYWPEPYPLEDVCEELVRHGHEVDVITGVPNYPMGVIYDGYKHGKNREQTHNGVHIHRCFTIGRRHNILFRFLNYYSYSISSTICALRAKKEYDVVFANQTSPVMMARAGLAYAKKHNKKCVLYCMDLWPACLAAGGVGENSILYKFFGRVSGRMYRRADRILITSKMFRSYLEENFGIEDEKIAYHPQYANNQFEAIRSASQEKKTTDFVFAGNVGAAQSLRTVLDAAALLRDDDRLRWHIVGDGSELERLKVYAEERKLDNVIFHGRRPLQEMPEYYAMADAMLVTLTADPFISLTLPGKVQTYMAAGKPIIAAANGEIPAVIEASGCGFCARAEDAAGLADAVRAFLHSQDRERYGKNARAYYEAHFTRDMFMKRLENELRNNCSGSIR